MDPVQKTQPLLNTGIPAECWNAVQAVFQRHGWIQSTRLYGSRAVGKHHQHSDVNLVVYGEPPTLSEVRVVESELQALGTRYIFDLLAYAKVPSPSLRSHMDHDGVEVYPTLQLSTHDVPPDHSAELSRNNVWQRASWGWWVGVLVFVLTVLLTADTWSLFLFLWLGDMVPFTYFLVLLVKPVVFGVAAGGLVRVAVSAVRSTP